MLRRYRQIQIQIHQLMDACIFALSFWLAFALRSSPRIQYHFSLGTGIGTFEDYVWLYVILIPAGPLVLEVQGFYNRPVLGSRKTTAWELFKGCLIMTLGLILALFCFRLLIARWVVVWFGCISFILVFVKEELLRLAFKSKLAREQYRRRFILVGPQEEVGQMRAELVARSEEEVEVVAELDLNLTPVQRLTELLHEQSVNGVILSVRRAYFEQVEEAIRACELEGVEVWLVADFLRTQISRASFDEFQGHPVLVLRSAPEASWQSLAKLVMDFSVSTASLIVGFVIIMLPVALMVRLTSKGPIFFRQKRSGLNGRPFTMYKFRTMVTNAEELKTELIAKNEMTGPVFKVKKDPRVTPIGRFLRKFSLDEFPQLINVVRGEMSLVGPRPLPVDEVQRFSDLAHRRRLSVKPGITGLWQVSGRSTVTDFKDWVRLDLEYIDNWSLWLDMKILVRTLPIVLKGAGAS
jgi:exopolysaccharide biosynthesis polyprenyl glycosylphosphotransferase